MPIRLSSNLVCREHKRLEAEQMSDRASALQQQNAHLKGLLAHKNQEKHLLARWERAAHFAAPNAFPEHVQASQSPFVSGSTRAVLHAVCVRLAHDFSLGAHSGVSSFRAARQGF